MALQNSRAALLPRSARGPLQLAAIGLMMLLALLLAGCGNLSSEPTTVEGNGSSESTGDGQGGEQLEPAAGGDVPTYVEVPGTDRRGDIFDFSYTTERGTELTCVVYDRAGYKSAAGGMFCFEEGPDGGMISPLPRPQR